MMCEEVRAELEEYFDGELEPGRRELLRRHLEGCLSCGEEFAELGRLEAVMRSAVPSSPIPSAGFVESVVRRAAPTRRSAWQGVAAMAAAVLLGWTLWGRIPILPERDLQEILQEYSEASGDLRAKLQGEVEQRGEGALPDVVRALRDPSIRVQIGAARALADSRFRGVRDVVLAEAPVPTAETDWVLGEIGEEEADNELVEVAFDLASGEENRAREVLRRIDRSGLNREARGRIVEKLVADLKSSETGRKAKAVDLASELGVRFPLAALADLIDSPELGASALDVLRRSTSRDFGGDREAWKRYLAGQPREY